MSAQPRDPDFQPFQPPTLEELAGMLPQYEIHDFIAQGGMGAVYLGRQDSLDRYVAIKVLPPTPEGEIDAAERFKIEARAMARLTHNNIVGVYDFGVTSEGHLYLVMEFVDGDTLHHAIHLGRVTPDKAKTYALQLCDALTYAHERGILHRDIKPGNVLLNNDDSVKVADFGLARPMNAHDQEVALGTPEYTAPEVITEGMLVDHRADIYALGVVIYEMLTGTVPDADHQPPSAFAPSVSTWDSVFLKATKADPNQRYQKVSELRDAIQNMSQKSGAVPRPSGTSHSAGPKPQGPRPIIRPGGVPARSKEQKKSGLPVTALVALAVLGGGGWFAYQKFMVAPDAAQGGTVSQPSLQPPSGGDTSTPAPPNAIASAFASLASLPPGHAFRFSEAHQKEVLGVIILPNQTQAVTCSNDGTVKVWDFSTGTVLRTLGPFPGSLKDTVTSLRQVAVSGDGAFLAAGGNEGRVRLWDLATGELKAECATAGSITLALEFTPDNSTLLIGSDNDGAGLESWIWTVPGAAPEVLTTWKLPVRGISFLKGPGDPKFLSIGSLDLEDSVPEIWIGSPVTKSPAQILKSPAQPGLIKLAAVSPDGRGAYVRGSSIVILDLQNDAEIATCTGHEAEVGSIAFLDNGRLLISSSRDRSIRIWETASGSEVHKIEVLTGASTVIDVSSDGTWVASTGGVPAAQDQPQEGDYSLHVWKLPALGTLASPQGRVAEAMRRMAELSAIDAELATLRDKWKSEWDAAIASSAAQTQEKELEELEARYLAALQRKVVTVPLASRDPFLNEISRVANHGTPPATMDLTWPPDLQHLFGIYLDQVTKLKAQGVAGLTTLANQQRASIAELVAARQLAGDEAAHARSQAVQREMEGRFAERLGSGG